MFFKVYVQDILRSKLEAEVHQVIHEDKGHLYVCGDVRMARDVAQTLREMFAKRLKLTEEQAEEYVSQLKVWLWARGMISPTCYSQCSS